MLASTSPFFQSLLECGFAESSLVTSKETITEVLTSTAAGDDSESSWDGTEDDSDEETDVLVAKAESSAQSESAQKGNFHDIESPASFTTCRAVLVYLLSNHISFAPLLSTFLASTYPTGPEATAARRQAVQAIMSKNPDLPAPALPK